MWLIIGLGNPGPKYLFTRHNIGFMTVDLFLKRVGETTLKKEKRFHLSQFRLNTKTVIVVKPQAFMNLSGEIVKHLIDYFNIEQDQLLVIHDDIDQSFGYLKFQKNRGPGGHNGIKSIHQHLGDKNYARLKMGVGRPINSQIDVADYVLQDFSSNEKLSLHQFTNIACEAIECFILEGLEKASNLFNRQVISQENLI